MLMPQRNQPRNQPRNLLLINQHLQKLALLTNLLQIKLILKHLLPNY
jgi:hypothetical protein